MTAPRRPKILIVDDITLNRKILAHICTKLGFGIVEATNGLEACEAFTREDGIVAIFLDLKMPLLDGWKTARRLRQLESTCTTCSSDRIPRAKSRLPVIACTSTSLEEAYEGATVSSSALSAGADEVLMKPMRISTVELMLDRYLPIWREITTTSSKIASCSCTESLGSAAVAGAGAPASVLVRQFSGPILPVPVLTSTAYRTSAPGAAW
eukprot:CAMPEP_0202891276 /NCGR_PEP_ID=MMETSP1392-20130828/1372_1 /ASSEMBLY_ACC=CAM_ASM_000868 /TAXON_ID=225041 /ORGANISM="Chlamydomonas chlamydogama, Strain SAG 11-48b" /LENGTH=209 /DNA_ID=CAMNT_0049574979 /DNA_START=192 /DNA_END=818 /DNA_ORIENTATION=+